MYERKARVSFMISSEFDHIQFQNRLQHRDQPH